MSRTVGRANNSSRDQDMSWKEKYEHLLNKTVKEIEETSLAAQRQSQLNMEASREYIDELKAQLQRSQERVKLLEERLACRSESPSVVSVEPPIKQTTPICISSDEGSQNEKPKSKNDKTPQSSFSFSSSARKRKIVKIDEHVVKRLEFFESITSLNVHVLSADAKSTVYLCTLDDGELMGHEFRLELSYDNWEYTYTPVKPSLSLKENTQFTESFFFPDYMLPRFLIKILDITYRNENKPLDYSNS